MNTARIVGTVVSTIKKKELTGKKILLIQPVDSDLNKAGDVIAAVDSIGAGEGEYVIYTTSKEAIVPLGNEYAVTDATLIAVIDYFQK